jgi:hypothetical protein
MPRRQSQKKISGTQRPLSVLGYEPLDASRRYDLEILDNIVRHDNMGATRETLEAYYYCYEVRHTLNLAANSAFVSTDGDDQGWTVARDYNFGTAGVPDYQDIDEEVYRIAMDLKHRESWPGEYVIGGDKLGLALKQALGLGDSFIEFGVEKEGIGRNDWAITRAMFLPPFEMFRLEDDHGYLVGFEQRAHLNDEDAIRFPQWKVAHLRYDQDRLYGQSAWKSSIATGTWAKLKESTNNLATALRDLGINPNVHQFSENMNQAHREVYIKAHESAKLNGLAPRDLYPLPGMEISKLSSQNPNLSTLIDGMLEWRYKMMLPGMPFYFFAGVMNGSARELSAQPALQHCRLRSEWCGMLTKIVTQAINTEIRLKKGEQFWREKGRFFRIVWPIWSAQAMLNGANNDESTSAGITDMEDDNDGQVSASQQRRLIALDRVTRYG